MFAFFHQVSSNLFPVLVRRNLVDLIIYNIKNKIYSSRDLNSWTANINNGLHLTDRSIPSRLSNLSNLHLIWCRFSRIHKVGYSELINFKLFGFISLSVDVTGNELLKVEFVNLCSDRWPWTLLNHPFFCPNRWETDRVKITAFYSHHFSICRLSQTQASSINSPH